MGVLDQPSRNEALSVPNALEIQVPDLCSMTGLPESVIIAWKQRKPIEAPLGQIISEMSRLWTALAEVVKPEAISPWLTLPNAALGGLTPIEVLRRGESDRIRELIYHLESGMPV